MKTVTAKQGRRLIKNMRQGRRPSIKHLDDLWSLCVKARDKHRSQRSGKTENLNAHHILGKATYRLRYHLDNGITITWGEHHFIAHGDRTRASKFEDWALRRLGKEKEELLRRLKYETGGVDLCAVELYLKTMLQRFQGKPLSIDKQSHKLNLPITRKGVNVKNRLRTIGRHKALKAMAHKDKMKGNE